MRLLKIIGLLGENPLCRCFEMEAINPAFLFVSSRCTVGNFHRFSDIGDIVPQKWVKWTHRWIKCAENWFQIFLASGLYDHVAFGLENFVTLMKIGMLSRREKIFLHAKIQQIRSRNGWDTAQLMFLPWPFIYWLCKAVEANPRKSPKWAFHQ